MERPTREIIGRQDELAAITRFVSDSAAFPSALVLEGEAGIGKTTLWERGVELARDGGLRVLAARPTQAELELPYASLADLLEAVSDDDLQPLPGPQRASIESVLARASSGRPVHWQALSRGVLELVRSAAHDGRLLVAVDEAQWLDRPTAAILAFALRRVPPQPIRVFVTARFDSQPDAVRPAVLDEWSPPIERLHIKALSTTELGGLLMSALGEHISRPHLETLASVSGGNPMFALELARTRAFDGATVTLPSTLARVLMDRVEALDPPARLAVQVAATALHPSVELLLRAGVDAEGLKSARRAGILDFDGSRVSFTHPLLSTAAYETLLPHERIETHSRLAAASENGIERGHHVARCTTAPSEGAALVLDEAGAEASALGDHGGAARFFVRAAELTPARDGPIAAGREIRGAAALSMAGDTEAAATLARALVTRLPPGPARARARLTLASSTVGSSLSVGGFVDEIERALDDAEGDDELIASLHLVIADALSVMFRLEDAREHVWAAAELAERDGLNQIVIAALAEAGFEDSMLGYGVSDSALRAFERWDKTPASATVYSPGMVLGCARLHASDLEEAARLFVEEIDIADRHGLEAIEAAARAHLAEAQLRSGQSAAALANARLALGHAQQAAQPQEIGGTAFTLALVYAVLGDHSAALSLSRQSLATAEASGDTWYTISHRAVLGLVALAEGDAAAVIDALEPAWTLMRQGGLGNLSIFPVPHVLAEAYAAAGRLDEAKAVVQTLRNSRAGDRPWSVAMAARCGALIASAEGDPESADRLIETALAAHENLHEPFELARTLLVKGQLARRAKRRANARDALTKALEIFDALGAARWAERAAADLARVSGRAAATGGLTETERRVAECVAEGLSNKEVAARLFVSVRAVEANLSKIYVKLGVRSRTQLARRLRS